MLDPGWNWTDQEIKRGIKKNWVNVTNSWFTPLMFRTPLNSRQTPKKLLNFHFSSEGKQPRHYKGRHPIGSTNMHSCMSNGHCPFWQNTHWQTSNKIPLLMKCKISLRIFKSNNSDLFSTILSANYSEPIAKAILNALGKMKCKLNQ